MNTKHNRKNSVIAALGVAATAVAAPAMLFAGAGHRTCGVHAQHG